MAEISEIDRERLADVLTRHVGAGRIDLTEYDERVARVYSAKTRAEAYSALGDLPATRPEPQRRHSGIAPSFWYSSRFRAMPWAFVSVLSLIIWAATVIGTGSLLYFWPVWVIGPWGLVVLGWAVVDRIPWVALCSTRKLQA